MGKVFKVLFLAGIFGGFLALAGGENDSAARDVLRQSLVFTLEEAAYRSPTTEFENGNRYDEVVLRSHDENGRVLYRQENYINQKLNRISLVNSEGVFDILHDRVLKFEVPERDFSSNMIRERYMGNLRSWVESLDASYRFQARTRYHKVNCDRVEMSFEPTEANLTRMGYTKEQLAQARKESFRNTTCQIICLIGVKNRFLYQFTLYAGDGRKLSSFESGPIQLLSARPDPTIFKLPGQLPPLEVVQEADEVHDSYFKPQPVPFWSRVGDFFGSMVQWLDNHLTTISDWASPILMMVALSIFAFLGWRKYALRAKKGQRS